MTRPRAKTRCVAVGSPEIAGATPTDVSALIRGVCGRDVAFRIRSRGRAGGEATWPSVVPIGLGHGGLGGIGAAHFRFVPAGIADAERLALRVP